MSTTEIQSPENGAAMSGVAQMVQPGQPAADAPHPSLEAMQQIEQAIEDHDNEFERLKNRLHELNVKDMELRECEDDIREQEGIITELKGQLAAAKEELKLRIGAMRAIVRRRERQRNLFNEPKPEENPPIDAEYQVTEEPPPEIDPKFMAIEELHAPEGYTEKMREAGITTVGELERRIGAGEFIPGCIKGIGEAAVTKITDCLVNFRNDHPAKEADGMTGADSGSLLAKVNEQADAETAEALDEAGSDEPANAEAPA